MSLAQLLAFWERTPQIAENIAHWERVPPRTARTVPLPDDLHPALREGLLSQGIRSLYLHQSQSWSLSRAGNHVAIATGTASGKTLCYNLPVLDALLRDEPARALYLFPTKALAQDQRKHISNLQPLISPHTYDGDTPRAHRAAIREQARLVMSNPDMLHAGMLPYHTRWAAFFASLRFVVVDEMHVYRGVFGSHVANVLRRLKRVAAFYGASPQFILTSATIANPVELAGKLVEAPVELVNADGSARGGQHFLIYNPPVVNEELNLRRGILQESVYLSADLLAYGVQHIIFARSRRMVELVLRYLREEIPSGKGGAGSRPSDEAIQSYRSGYLPAQRRAIEAGIRSGAVRAVAATNALELGMDIGGMDAVLLAGYPGSISGAWQQAGRAGRGSAESLAVLMTSASPLDQYLARHPEFFFGQSPEAALLNPDNLLILLDHLRCAAFELPFRPGEGYGLVDGATVEEYLNVLTQGGELTASASQYFWTADDAPAQAVSLRTASARRIHLLVGGETTIGEVDAESANWMVHPGAIYLHQGASYLVESLNPIDGYAQLTPFEPDYYTEPKRETEVSLIAQRESDPAPGGTGVPVGARSHGEILVTSQVTGYRKIQWFTQERLGDEPLDMPPSRLQTAGYWLTLSPSTVDALREAGLWGGDPNEYGSGWARLRDAARARDGYTCQSCGAVESGRAHHVHHKIPFRTFASPAEANRLENLTTLCPACHRRVEAAVRVRSGLSGLAYALGNLAPLFLMCDPSDIQAHADPQSPLADGEPAVVIYERIPAGIGFAARLYEIHADLLRAARDLVDACPCADGCPSCVGPGGELGRGAKEEVRGILGILGGGK
jgi:DEAD/DEAH box helicase domain-containing protein